MRETVICYFCSLPSAVLGLDKKGAPYLRCGVCHSVVFVHTEAAHRKLLQMCEQARAAVNENLSRQMLAVADRPVQDPLVPSHPPAAPVTQEVVHAE